MESGFSLTDESIMPYGKYKDKALEDVPASYLLWLEGQLKKHHGNSKFNILLLDYIEDNRDELEKEMKS